MSIIFTSSGGSSRSSNYGLSLWIHDLKCLLHQIYSFFYCYFMSVSNVFHGEEPQRWINYHSSLARAIINNWRSLIRKNARTDIAGWNKEQCCIRFQTRNHGTWWPLQSAVTEYGTQAQAYNSDKIIQPSHFVTVSCLFPSSCVINVNCSNIIKVLSIKDFN